jgi:hypothetical protein
MPNKKSRTPFHYSRSKGKIEIDGDPKDTKLLAWLDMVMHWFTWIGLTILLILVLPKASFLLLVWKFIRDRFFVILVAVRVDCLLDLSVSYL